MIHALNILHLSMVIVITVTLIVKISYHNVLIICLL